MEDDGPLVQNFRLAGMLALVAIGTSFASVAGATNRSVYPVAGKWTGRAHFNDLNGDFCVGHDAKVKASS